MHSGACKTSCSSCFRKSCCCRLEQRAALLRVGLRDSDAKVQAAATKLLCAWYSEAGGDMLELLVQLDCENYTGKLTLQ